MPETNSNIALNASSDLFTISPDWDFDFSNQTNGSSLLPVDQDERDLWREIPLGILLTLLCLLTTVGNAMVLHAVRTERRLQSVSNTKT